jgi:hypothetical protein
MSDISDTSRLNFTQYNYIRNSILATATRWAVKCVQGWPTDAPTPQNQHWSTRSLIVNENCKERLRRITTEVEAILYSSGFFCHAILRKVRDTYQIKFHITQMTKEEYENVLNGMKEGETEF